MDKNQMDMKIRGLFAKGANIRREKVGLNSRGVDW